MSNITLTIPNDDHIALRAFGKALEEMALAHGAEPKQSGIWVDQQFNIHPTAEAALAADQNEALVKANKEENVNVDTTAQQVESLSERKPTIEILPTYYPEQPIKLDAELENELTEPTTDSTGTPWDERIHSASKALNADGTWRLRRKPKDMDEAEWTALVESVKGELHTQTPVMTDEEVKVLEPVEIGGVGIGESDDIEQKMEEFKETVRQRGEANKGVTIISQEGVEVVTEELYIDEGCDHVSIDPAHDKGDETAELTIEPPVTPPGDDFHTDAGVVTEQTVAGIPPIPVPPVATGAMLDALAEIPVPPPVTTATLELNLPTPPHTIPVTVEVVNDWDFPKLMKFLTERHGKIDVPTVNQLLAVDGLAALTDLNAHPDKIGPFVARVKAHLGE